MEDASCRVYGQGEEKDSSAASKPPLKPEATDKNLRKYLSVSPVD
jgi:hypothetical protein